MKKFLCFFILLSLSTTVCFARSAEYKLKHSQLKNAKNAKMTVINSQINSIKNQIENLAMDSSVSDTNKNAKLNQYQNKLESLNNEKYQINQQYKKDKKKLKHKH